MVSTGSMMRYGLNWLNDEVWSQLA